MQIEPALVGPVCLFFGALVGGSASLFGAIYSQHCQGRVQRVASEIAKRETVYADFVMSASSLLLKAYTRDEILLSGDEQRLIGLINRMRLFAPPDVVEGAEAARNADKFAHQLATVGEADVAGGIGWPLTSSLRSSAAMASGTS